MREKIGAAVEVKAERLRVAPEEYCRLAASSFSEMLALVEEVSLGETWFFRAPHQFDYLRDVIFPSLVESGVERLRIWSAACSTGEGGLLPGHRIRAIRPVIPASAGRGLRDRRAKPRADGREPGALQGDSLREVSPQTLERYFERGTNSTGEPDGTHIVIADVRRRVTFRRVNLLERAYWKSIPNRFDLIVCSNLLTFLSNTAARQMVTNLTNSLRVGGYLMVAPGEESRRLSSVDTRQRTLVIFPETRLITRSAASKFLARR